MPADYAILRRHEAAAFRYWLSSSFAGQISDSWLIAAYAAAIEDIFDISPLPPIDIWLFRHALPRHDAAAFDC
jgi:hypothetical protein